MAEYHNDVVDSVTLFLRALSEQSAPRFLGLSIDEVNTLIHDRVAETNLRSSFAILAAVEAALRIDYLRRVKQRLKDPLSRAFRDIHKTRKEHVRFDEDILQSWSQHHPEFKRLVGALRSALHFRHWLAHGRYWLKPEHGKLDYIEIYDLAVFMFEHMPLQSN